MQEEGTALLAAVADTHPPAAEELPAGTAVFTDGAEMIAAGGTDIVAIATPIHTHFDLASAAIEAGNDVLLEKPTTATLEQFEELVALAGARGARVQIGFQSLGSEGIRIIRDRIASGEIGDVVRYGARGTWLRSFAYFNRSKWAGKRRMDGVVVADGALTNPFAHATATALAIAGATRVDDVRGLELDLWRANDIEADDTSVAIFELPGGVRLTTAVTVAAREQVEPLVDVVGSEGTIRFWYTQDVIERLDASGVVVSTETVGRSPLLENLVDARTDGAPLIAPLVETGAFMRLVEGVMSAPDPRRAASAEVATVDDEWGPRRVIAGVAAEVDRALREERTFTQLGSAFTRG
ncbi:Gfo/Idh/MocA family protein [Microbacterium halophytorum]|uniref:Gfo/Idh/MocA family protein n=1 Tax=Microbacterium halophytorum TaxID=2067568 RepID=UPI0038CBF8AE